MVPSSAGFGAGSAVYAVVSDLARDAAYERILVVCDCVPTGLPDFPDRRRSQLLAELCHLWPSARVTVLAFDFDRLHDGRAWLEGMGVEVVVPPIDLHVWMEARRLEFSLVLLAGRSTHQLAAGLRATQPQALLAVDLPDDIMDVRAHFDSTLRLPEERLGERLVGTFERRRLEEVIAISDVILTETASLIGHAGNQAKSFVFDGVLRPPPPPGPGYRTGGVIAARSAEEFADPDEAGIEQILGSSRLAAEGGFGWLRFCLRRPPPALRRRIAALAPIATEALQLEVASARLLLTARPFGAPPRWQQRLAFETGTPWVLLGPEPLPGAIHVTDASGLHQAVAPLLEDDEAWRTAQLELIELASRFSSRESRAGLMSLLGSVGFAPPSHAALGGPPAPLRVLERFTQLVDEPGSFHGQIRSAGWNERRPMNPVMQRSDLPPDFLVPQTGYAWWYDAHRFSAEAMRRSAAFAHQLLISIVMPVYNTDPEVLHDTITSVRSQLYRNWELCIADDASTSVATLEVLDRHAREDARIRVHRMARNGGIAEASNAAAALATGEFIALLDHDDLLTPDALFEVVALLDQHPDLDFVYSDEDKLDEQGKLSTPFFKPSWSPELHLCVNYVTHFAVYRKSVFDRLGGFRPNFDGSQDYDLSLRLTEATDRVGHIAKPIYTWRMVAGSAAISHDAKPYAVEAARRAVSDALRRRGAGGRVDEGMVPGTWRPRYPIVGQPTVSVLIPTRNGRKMLERCLEGVLRHTAYGLLELVIVDNGSDEPETLDYLAGLDATVVRYPYRFNYARQMNLAAAAATGDLLLLLNNDVEILDPGWLEAMVEHAQRPDVGAVGARLVFPSGRPQHEGVFVGFGGGCAGNIDFGGYFHLGRLVRDCTAVTAACMMTRPAVFSGVGGFDERLRVAFNDVDFCLRLRQRGYRIVYTPYAELVHAESASRGALHPAEDEGFFVRRWGHPEEFDDPFYNPNLDPVRPFRLIR